VTSGGGGVGILETMPAVFLGCRPAHTPTKIPTN